MKNRVEARVKGRLDRQSKAAKRIRQGNKIPASKKPQWYELTDYFDPKEIAPVTVRGSGFMLGPLEDFVVVEVPSTFSGDQRSLLGKMLGEMGLKSLIVAEGIRFLRLSGVSEEVARELSKQSDPRPEAASSGEKNAQDS